jgi:hypothetical protein
MESEEDSVLHGVEMSGFILALLGSEITLSGLIVEAFDHFVTHSPSSLDKDIALIWGVLVSTLPLTVAITMMVVLYKRGELSVLGAMLILLLSAVIGNLLHLGMHTVDFSAAATGSSNLFFGVVIGYLKAYHGYPVLKSCVVGFFFGRWYYRRTK